MPNQTGTRDGETWIKPVTVEHLTNSLAQIELWVHACRLALAKLDKSMEIRLSPKELEVWKGPNSPLKTTRECPPPD